MSQVRVNSLDVHLDVHRDIVPVVPIFPAVRTQNGLNSFHSHSPSHQAHVAANDSSSHESPNEYNARTVDDSHLQGSTAELTVSRDMWSFPSGQSPCCLSFRFCQVFICAFVVLDRMPRFQHFCNCRPLRRFQRRAVLLNVACEVNVAVTSEVLLPSWA